MISMKTLGKMKLLLASAALLLLLCGCGGKGQDGIIVEFDPSAQTAEKNVTITFFGFKSDALNLVAIEAALHDFMDANPDIDVTYEGIKGSPYWEALTTRAGTGNMDDIMMVDHDRINLFTGQGKLADLSGLSTIKNFLPMARSQFTEPDGSIYFLPTCISTYNLYINTDLLEQHGQKLPENLTEFTTVCDYFVKQGITPIIANNYYSLGSLMVAKGMYPVYQAEDPVAEIQKFNRGEADLLKQLHPGVELVADMAERSWLDEKEVLSTNQTSDDLALFSQGERPFMITGGWASPRLDVDFSYGVYPYPIMEDGSVLSMDVNTCVSISAESDHMEETKRLLEFITQPDVMWSYCDSQSSYSPLEDDRVPTDITIAPSAPYLTNGRNVLGSDYNLDFPMDTALRECENGIMEGMTVDEAMAVLSSWLYPASDGRECAEP